MGHYASSQVSCVSECTVHVREAENTKAFSFRRRRRKNQVDNEEEEEEEEHDEGAGCRLNVGFTKKVIERLLEMTAGK